MGGNDIGVGQRPQGVSANVPQEAIDEMMREHPTGGDG